LQLLLVDARCQLPAAEKNMVCAPPEHKKKYGGPYFFNRRNIKHAELFFWADLIFLRAGSKKTDHKNIDVL